MKYSLIIPHFNDVERLERLLRTVPIERPDLEVIVVDDCSPDRTALDTVRKNWSRVHWLSTPNNAGAGVARNVGLNAAQGRYLVFADSDDEFLLGAFDTFDDVLRADDELVYFLAEAVQESDGSPSIRSEAFNKLVTGYLASPSEETLERLQVHHVVPYAKVYSRSFIQAHEIYFDAVRWGNDVSFNVLAAVQAQSVRAEAIIVYRIFRRSGSLTANLSANAFFTRFLVARSVAQQVVAFDIQSVPSATGYMLSSFRYGPRVVFRVWWLAIRSPMQIEWTRIFDLTRWHRFVSMQRRAKQEQLKG